MTLSNIHLELEIGDWVQQHLYFLGEYEPSEFLAVQRIVQPGATVIDIGANIGWYTLNLAEWVGSEGRVIGFEPFPQNFQSLEKNIQLNTFNNITAENIAIGQEEGELILHLNTKENNRGMVSVIPTDNAIHESVKVTTLDLYLTQNPVEKLDFIKIDIEGNEYSALLGMHKTLENFSPAILLEIRDLPELKELNTKCLNLLNSMGYKQYVISQNGNLTLDKQKHSLENYMFLK